MMLRNSDKVWKPYQTYHKPNYPRWTFTKNKQVRGVNLNKPLFTRAVSTWHCHFRNRQHDPNIPGFPGRSGRTGTLVGWSTSIVSPSSNSKRYVGWMRLGHPRNHQLGGDKNHWWCGGVLLSCWGKKVDIHVEWWWFFNRHLGDLFGRFRKG